MRLISQLKLVIIRFSSVTATVLFLLLWVIVIMILVLVCIGVRQLRHRRNTVSPSKSRVTTRERGDRSNSRFRVNEAVTRRSKPSTSTQVTGNSSTQDSWVFTTNNNLSTETSCSSYPSYACPEPTANADSSVVMTTNSAYGAGEQSVSQPPSSAGGAVHYDDPLNANCSATDSLC